MAKGHNGDLKCPLPDGEQKKFRALLMTRRREIAVNIGDLIRDAVDAEDGNVAPDHQADRGSDVDLQETSLGQVGNEEDLLWQIDRAIGKLDTGKPVPFGICEHTLKPIPKTRLAVIPWTPLSIEGANAMEAKGLTIQDMLASET